MRLSPVTWRGAIAGAALVLWAAGASRPLFNRASHVVREASRQIPKDTLSARRQFRGAKLIDAIELIKQEVPPDARYLLVEGRSDITDSYVVRGYLAPRKAEFLGPAAGIDEAALARLEALSPPMYVVLAWTPENAPALSSTADLRALLRKR